MTAAAISVKGLLKRFGKVNAVDGVSFEVYRGECFGLLGPNGAGKSTTIKMMTGLLQPDEGTIMLEEVDVGLYPARARELIGYVPQAVSIEGVLTGYENLSMFGKIYGLPRKVRRERIDRIVHMLGLEEAIHRQAKTYSGGMVRRLEIGQAILHHPRILFLDEPTVGLDPMARESVWKHIHALRTEEQMTVLVTTHYMEEAQSMCSRLAIMSRGSVAALGTVAELRQEVGEEADMNEIFTCFAGHFEDQHREGGMRDVNRQRRTARRLG